MKAVPKNSRTRVTSLVVVATVIVAVVAMTRAFLSPAELSSATAPPPPTRLTERVELRELTEVVELTGTFRADYTTEVGLVGPEGVDAVLTAMPVSAGQDVTFGAVLAEISGRPVVALPGELPAYRDLVEGDEGPDVVQLQDALRQVGFRVDDRKGRYGSSTARALRQLYSANGYVPLVEQPANDDARTEDAASPMGEPSNLSAVARQRLPASEVVYLPQASRVSSVRHRGAVLGDTVSALTVSSVEGAVVARASAEQRSRIVAGQTVEITGGATSVSSSTVAAVADRATTDDSGTEGYEVHVVWPSGTPPTVGESLTLRISVAATSGPVLSVPATAVYGSSDDDATIQVVRDDRVIPVPVNLGLAANGFVEVSPASGIAISQGDLVVVGAR